MPDLKIISEEPVSMVQLKESLKHIKQRDTELNFRANKTQEYLDIFVTLPSKDAEALQKEIGGLEIPRLRKEHIIKIIDLLPTSIEDLKLILNSYTSSITVNAENQKKIIDVVNKFHKKK